MLLPHLSEFLRFIVSIHFAKFTSILIVHNSTSGNSNHLQLEYLHGLQRAFESNEPVGLQWIDVATLSPNDLNDHLLQSVNNSAIEGFITVLPDTGVFLHSRYYATRYAHPRLKDKLYLFLCVDEDPNYLLANEVLQFYPHHLMVRPTPAPPPPPSLVVEEVGLVNKECDGDVSMVVGTLPHRDINFELWTQKFVGGDGNLDAVQLGAFFPNETFPAKLQLYPNKLLNMEGRTLRMGSVTYVPYTITNYVPAGVGNEDPINPHAPNRSIEYFGSEANIMKTFCQLHNCHLRVEAYGADNWGSIYENETGDGMLGDIYMQRVELAIGCIYNWYDAITETSHPIARSAVTILGPAPGLVPAWRNSILPFNGGVWILLLITVGICSLALYGLKTSNYSDVPRRRRNSMHIRILEKSLLDIFALFIQQPSAPTTFDRFAARFFLATLLCATITLENIYSGQLKSLLTIPFSSAPVDTMMKWAETGWKWAAPSIIWVHTVENSDLAMEQLLARSFEVRDYDFLYNASFRPDYGLGVERLASGSIAFGNYITPSAVENRIVLRDDLYFDWTRAVSIRGWALMPLLNQHIRACFESGLYSQWEQDFMAKYVDKQTEVIIQSLENHHTVKHAPKALDVHNISGALFVLAFGLTFAICILLVEWMLFAMQLCNKWF